MIRIASLPRTQLACPYTPINRDKGPVVNRLNQNQYLMGDENIDLGRFKQINPTGDLLYGMHGLFNLFRMKRMQGPLSKKYLIGFKAFGT